LLEIGDGVPRGADMDVKKKKIVKVAVIVGVVALIGYAGWLLIPHLTGSNHDLRRDSANSPMALMEWMMRAASKDEPVRIWNAMSEGYRAEFESAFKLVDDGTVPAEPWVKAASKAGVASSEAEFKALVPMKKFVAWWHLEDRTLVGFRVPVFLEAPFGKSPVVTGIKVFYDDRARVNASESFLLYRFNDRFDLAHFVQIDGMWLLDVAKDIPEGM